MYNGEMDQRKGGKTELDHISISPSSSFIKTLTESDGNGIVRCDWVVARLCIIGLAVEKNVVC